MTANYSDRYTGATYNAEPVNDPVARYKYLLSTAAPDQIEAAHREAFASMTPAERQQVLTVLANAGETPVDGSAPSLARSATRAEMKQPGTLGRLFGNTGVAGSAGLGTTIASSLVAGFIGSAVFSGLTGGDGVGGRPGLLSRLFGFGHHGMGGMMGGPGMGMGGPGGGMFGGGFGGGPGGFGGFGGGPGGGPR